MIPNAYSKNAKHCRPSKQSQDLACFYFCSLKPFFNLRYKYFFMVSGITACARPLVWFPLSSDMPWCLMYYYMYDNARRGPEGRLAPRHRLSTPFFPPLFWGGEGGVGCVEPFFSSFFSGFFFKYLMASFICRISSFFFSSFLSLLTQASKYGLFRKAIALFSRVKVV